MQKVDFWINLIANLMTIAASGIAIYIFLTNRDKIGSAINFLLNYSNQLTLTDLRFKIERLNEFNANDNTQKNEVINILHELEGQINGNQMLNEKLHTQLAKINNYTSSPKNLNEPRKRSLVSELRESIRNIDVSNYNKLVNNKS